MNSERSNVEAGGIWESWGDGGISKAEFDAHMHAKQARQVHAPLVGQPAPDFAIERLDTRGKQTGEAFRLSSVFGKPIALVFGSYT